MSQEFNASKLKNDVMNASNIMLGNELTQETIGFIRTDKETFKVFGNNKLTQEIDFELYIESVLSLIKTTPILTIVIQTDKDDSIAREQLK